MTSFVTPAAAARLQELVAQLNSGEIIISDDPVASLEWIVVNDEPVMRFNNGGDLVAGVAARADAVSAAIRAGIRAPAKRLWTPT